MADSAAVEQTIAECASVCVRIFDQCLVDELSPDYDNGWIEDQSARFRIWAANLGVFATGHATADYRLRDNDELRNLILQLLSAIRENLIIGKLQDME